ncbi:MAG: hypothetical protein FWJ59_04605 [Caldicoprobacter sp.]|uniref:hypothetical protein n=1 Tax=Caldicoprobacter sp. TaxID=2004500 RepID=UPI001D6AF5DC|nr:hypothetical protein [Clostridia bacterium]
MFLNIMLRFIQYIAKRVVALLILILLAILVTFTAYDCANIYIVVTEGLTQRVDAIMNNHENVSLKKFFSSTFLNSDPLLNNNVYADFIIQDYKLQLSIKKLWVWPWEDSTRVVVEEVVSDITATPIEKDQEVKTPPPWQNGEKIILLERKAGLWKINGIIFKKPIAE